jgi:hypothetical protein
MTINNSQQASFTNNINAPNTFGFKNRIINGAMVIDQRNAGATQNPAVNGNFATDRWKIESSVASKYSIQQNAGSVTPPAGFTNYLGVTSLSAYSVGSSDLFALQQWIEGYNIADLGFGTANAKTVTLSFWVYSSLTGTFGGALNGYNGSTFRSYPFTYTISSASTWTQIAITIPGDTTTFAYNTTNSYGLSLQIGLGVGSTNSATAGSWQSGNYASATGATSVVGTSGATFYLTGVQLEVGTNATNFDYRPYGTELALCQRYCCAFDNRVYSQTYYKFGVATWTGTTSAMVSVSFPVNMRVPPTSMTSSTVSSYFWIDSGTTNFTTCTLDQVSDKAGTFLLSNGSGGQPAGYGGRALSNGAAQAYVIFNAEL